MNINPGELKKQIEIIKRGEGYDADGYPLAAEEVVHRCRAKFTRTSGTETTRANADFGDVKCRFLIRATQAKIDRKMFVRYAGADYEIVYINDYGDAHEYVEIWCEQSTLEARA